jgi:kynureninase
MDSAQFDCFLNGDRIAFSDSKSTSLQYARHLDSTDTLANFRNEFLIPSKADLKDPHPETKPVDAQNGNIPLPSHLPHPQSCIV